MLALDFALVVDGWNPQAEAWEHFERRARARLNGALKQHRSAVTDQYANAKRKPRHLDSGLIVQDALAHTSNVPPS